jgi:hypothetical protein
VRCHVLSRCLRSQGQNVLHYLSMRGGQLDCRSAPTFTVYHKGRDALASCMEPSWRNKMTVR